MSKHLRILREAGFVEVRSDAQRRLYSVQPEALRAGLALFTRAPVDGHFARDVLPSMILLGFGAGVAFNPVLLAAMGDVEPSESGVASGIVNTAFMMGGALGLAVLASLAASRTGHPLALGDGPRAALAGGYHVAFLVGALFALLAALLASALLQTEDAVLPADEASAPGADHGHATRFRVGIDNRARPHRDWAARMASNL